MSDAFRVGGDAYDDFMGRYSTTLAALFADFAGVGQGARVLDVGAGTGALTAELRARGATVVAEEPSPEFAAVLRERFPDVEVHETPAEELPFADKEFDVALAQLVVAFVSDAPAAVGEMARVAGRVAVCMWGVAEVDMFAAIDRAAAAIGAPRATEPRRYRLPDGTETEHFPAHQSDFHAARPVYETLAGWDEPLDDCASVEELPEAAGAYVDFVESALGVDVTLIGTGAARERVLTRA